jgi:hypothetical protein
MGGLAEFAGPFWMRSCIAKQKMPGVAGHFLFLDGVREAGQHSVTQNYSRFLVVSYCPSLRRISGSSGSSPACPRMLT